MTQVTELGYIGIDISDPIAWKHYAEKVLCMEVLDERETDRFYLRMDNWHHRVVVHVNDGDDLAYVGWRVAGRPELEGMAEKLEKAGYPFRWGTAAEASERHVLGLLKMDDPGGIPTEIFYGPRVDHDVPMRPGRGLYGPFMTGEEGMGHVLLREPDPDAALRFYSLLGFRGGVDYLLSRDGGPQVPITFMHCNRRQHSVAWGLPPDYPKRMNHLMVQYADVRDVGIAHDYVRDHNVPVAKKLGMHANDNMLSFYSINPSGWWVESGWNGRASGQQEYSLMDVFGLQSEK